MPINELRSYTQHHRWMVMYRVVLAFIACATCLQQVQCAISVRSPAARCSSVKIFVQEDGTENELPLGTFMASGNRTKNAPVSVYIRGVHCRKNCCSHTLRINSSE